LAAAEQSASDLRQHVMVLDDECARLRSAVDGTLTSPLPPYSQPNVDVLSSHLVPPSCNCHLLMCPVVDATAALAEAKRRAAYAEARVKDLDAACGELRTSLGAHSADAAAAADAVAALRAQLSTASRRAATAEARVSDLTAEAEAHAADAGELRSALTRQGESMSSLRARAESEQRRLLGEVAQLEKALLVSQAAMESTRGEVEAVLEEVMSDHTSLKAAVSELGDKLTDAEV
jgi:septal ring factor EnvC (AmiA/AmiB activator)